MGSPEPLLNVEESWPVLSLWPLRESLKGSRPVGCAGGQDLTVSSTFTYPASMGMPKGAKNALGGGGGAEKPREQLDQVTLLMRHCNRSGSHRYNADDRQKVVGTFIDFPVPSLS